MARRFDGVHKLGAGCYRGLWRGAGERMEDRSLVLPLHTFDPVDCLATIFTRVGKETCHHYSGSTATAVLLDPRGSMTIAHLGDSPALFLGRDHDWFPEGMDLVVPHAPDQRGEQERLAALGLSNRVRGGRLYDEGGVHSLAISRAFGDADMEGVVSAPEILSVPYAPLLDSFPKAYICVASDGILGRFQNGPSLAQSAPVEVFDDAQALCTYLTACGRAMPQADNVTVLMQDLKALRQSVLLAVFDGHGGVRTARTAAALFRSLAQGPR